MDRSTIKNLIKTEKALAEINSLRRYLIMIEVKYADLLCTESIKTIKDILIEDFVLPLEDRKDCIKESCGLELD